MTTPSDDKSRFWGMSEKHFQALAKRGAVKAYPRNTVIVNEGDRSDSLYIILSGKVKVYLADEEGKEILLTIQGPGEYFGEMVLDQGPRSASVMTLEPAKFSVISTDEFRRFLTEHPDAGPELVMSLIHRVRELTKTVGNLALLDVYGRVARLLLELAEDVNGEMVISERLTQQDMASRVGCSREMISRILKDLRTGGYLKMDGERIIIAKSPPRGW